MKVFLTGGTGSLGKALIKQFHDKWDIVSFSRDELKLSEIERQYPDVRFIIGDVKDYPSVLRAMKGCDTVIHAAAMKRIEICEQHPMEAVKTNVYGTQNIIRAIYANGVSKAVVTGSDKGVEPINTYGMTKGLQEKLFAHEGLNSVRYGNVFASRGSVALLFADQVKRGATLTVTHSDMTRFILTMDDAIELILCGLTSPMDGSTFVKLSKAVRLLDLAHAYSSDIKVFGKFTGEKLHEMLINAEEYTRLKKLKGKNVAVIGKKTVKIEYGHPFTSDIADKLTLPEIKKLINKYVYNANTNNGGNGKVGHRTQKAYL